MPLTRARLNTELLPETSDTQAPRDAQMRDLAEMGRLIADLLESERLSGNHAPLNLELTDLGRLVRDGVADMEAPQRPKVRQSCTAHQQVRWPGLKSPWHRTCRWSNWMP